MLRLILGLLFIACLSTAALAEKRVALVFAADDYRTLRPLKNAVNDGRTVEAALDALGFEVYSETNRDLRRMRRALDDFREDAAGADVAVVYFSGHGVEIAGENRLLPVDADASSLTSLKETTLPLEEMRTAVAETARMGLIVLDACRNDPFGTQTGEGRGATALAPEVAGATRPGLGRMGRAENILFAFSAAPGETASDGTGGNSPFTAALAKYLPTEGLEIRSVLTLVQQEVYDLSRGGQLPYVESGLPQLFFATEAMEELPERERLLLAMADVTPGMRAEVERIAARKDMPLAPLYAALISADLAGIETAQRARKLEDAADAFVKVRAELQTLASADPQVAALRKQAEEQLALGAYETAHRLGEQAVALDHQSAEMLQDRARDRFLSEAATHYLNGGIARAALKYQEAIQDYQNATKIYGRFSNQDIPLADRRRQVQALYHTGNLFLAWGSVLGARISFQMALQVVEQEARKNPADLDWQREFATSQRAVGDALEKNGQLDEALAAYQTSFEIVRKLLAAKPTSLELQHDFATGLIKGARVLLAKNDLVNAEAAYRNGLAVAENLGSAFPKLAALKADVYIGRSGMGDLLVARGDADGALSAYMGSRDVIAGMLAERPGNAQLERDLAVLHLRIGRLLAGQQKAVDALAAYRQSFDALSLLVERDPDNLSLRYDRSAALQGVGDMMFKQGDLGGAMSAYQGAYSTLQELFKVDITNAAWQGSIADVAEKIGDIRAALGDVAGAAAAYQGELDFLATQQKLGSRMRNLQRRLVVLHYKLAPLGKNPRDHLNKALEIALDMQKQGLLAPADAGIPDRLRADLAKLEAR